jgi:aspartyl-tRNA(Asn)/glutamyl-tRNA(Gln) amidotransferase subunit B
MGEFKITIGCEIHTELKTKTKMFSPSLNLYSPEPNTNINEIDLGLPGTLPSPNKQAVILGILLAKILKMNINDNLVFDRKNYFYPDLPKGFQITQQYYPIGYDGKIKIDEQEYIEIERIHLEEDTAKQIAESDYIKLDFNRAGVPLLEIVSRPQIHSRESCIKYLKALRHVLVFNKISDGKMENGSLRVDLNISVSKTDKLGTKVEIKNINSFNNVGKAIDFEFLRQTDLLEKNQPVLQETRRWDDTTQSTIGMRSKSNAIDYKYFTEPNIINIDIKNLVTTTNIDEKNNPEHIAKH